VNLEQNTVAQRLLGASFMPEVSSRASSGPLGFDAAIDAIIEVRSFDQEELNKLLQWSIGRLMRKAFQSGVHLRDERVKMVLAFQ
jgi:hypothetical protein